MSASKKLAFAAAVTTVIAIGIPAASYAHSVVTAVPVAAAAESVVAALPDKPGGAPASPGIKPTSKLTLTGIDSGVKLVAQFNPKEISVDKSVPWQKAPTSTGDQPELQFRSADGRSMSFELFFDTFEQKTDVHATYVSKLIALASVIDPSPAAPEEKKRPTRVKVQWGTSALHFEGVIESVPCKYTMFLPDGTPVRATCVVQMKEASRATFKRP